MDRFHSLPRRLRLRTLGVLAFGLLVACGSSQDDKGDGGTGDGAIADVPLAEALPATDANDAVDSGDAAQDNVAEAGSGDIAQQGDARDIGPGDSGFGDGSSDAGGARPTVIPCSNCTLYQWDIPGEQLAYDSQRNRLYMTVGGRARAHANTLVTINMADLTLLSAPFIGSSPRALALSDDSSTLWVGIDGSYSLRRVVLTTTPPTFGPPQLIPPETTLSGPTFAIKIVPLPGAPASGAVLDGSGRVFVLDGDTPRPMATRQISISDLVAGPPGFLYAYDGGSTGHAFHTLAMSPGGVTTTSFPGLISGFSVRIHHVTGRVFAESGRTVDVTSPTAPVAGPPLALSGRIAVQSPVRLLVMTKTNAVGGLTPWRLAVLNPAESAERAFVPLPPSIFTAPSGQTSTVTHMVHAGGDAVAFLVTTPEAEFGMATRTYFYVIKSPILAAP